MPSSSTCCDNDYIIIIEYILAFLLQQPAQKIKGLKMVVFQMQILLLAATQVLDTSRGKRDFIALVHGVLKVSILAPQVRIYDRKLRHNFRTGVYLFMHAVSSRILL